MIKELDDLLAYCNEGEKDRCRRIDTGGSIPDREKIEFPVTQDCSMTAARYERWRRNVRNVGP